MTMTTYLFYTIIVATVVGLIAMRSTSRHRAPLPVSVTVAEDTGPMGVNKAVLASMLSEMVFYAYGYRPSDELAAEFSERLMAESRYRSPTL